MSKRLTEIQIFELFAFLKKMGVRHYDVQIELVDHLASAIENRWEHEPDLSFQRVLNQIYMEFDNNSFSKIIALKEKSLRKKYNQILWKHIFEFFKLPKIILTIAAVMVLFFAFRGLIGCKLMIYTFLGFDILCILISIDLFPRIFRFDLTSDRKFLLKDHLKLVQNRIVSIGVIPVMVNSGFALIDPKIQMSTSSNVFLHLFAALLMTFLSIILLGMCFYVPKRIKEDFTREFPQFVKA